MNIFFYEKKGEKTRKNMYKKHILRYYFSMDDLFWKIFATIDLYVKNTRSRLFCLRIIYIQQREFHLPT